jgi:hypothetical protein
VVGSVESSSSRRQSSRRESFHLKTLRSQRQTFFARVALGAGFLTGLGIVALTAAMILKPVTSQKKPAEAENPEQETVIESGIAQGNVLPDDGVKSGPFSKSPTENNGKGTTLEGNPEHDESSDLRGVVRDETGSSLGIAILGGLDRVVVKTEVNPRDARGAFRKLVDSVAKEQADAAGLRCVDRGPAVLKIRMSIEDVDNRSVLTIDSEVTVEDAETGVIDRVWARREAMGRVSKLMLSRGTVPPKMDEQVQDYFRVLRKDVASAARAR